MGTTVGKNAKGYNYTYTDLAQIHAEMENQGLRYRQCVERVDGQDYIKTQIYNVGEEGSCWLLGCKIVSAPLSGKSNAAQEQGSAITYARRYSLLMALGWATIDDDAESLTKKSKNTKEEKSAINSPQQPTCKICGDLIKSGKKNGETLTAKQVAEKTNGVCVECYKQAQASERKEDHA